MRMNMMKFQIDVFPGYNSEIIGPNPYYMFRETFNIKHLASLIPDDHDLPVPNLATPIDFENMEDVHAVDDDEEEEEEMAIGQEAN